MVRCLDETPNIRISHHYITECTYKIDEAGFAVGASQSSRAMSSVYESPAGRSLRDYSCYEAAVAAIPPAIILEA